ncbi:hypothetical protein GCM10025858_32230 [Alicyclobacillus sacchari]|nr:hypothetical protein GCM10025858_32230 [Alicyclobacillus sacchari]
MLDILDGATDEAPWGTLEQARGGCVSAADCNARQSRASAGKHAFSFGNAGGSAVKTKPVNEAETRDGSKKRRLGWKKTCQHWSVRKRIDHG